MASKDIDFFFHEKSIKVTLYSSIFFFLFFVSSCLLDNSFLQLYKNSIGKFRQRISFFIFGDDIMIFAKLTDYSCSTLKAILNNCSISSQLVNFYKFAFFNAFLMFQVLLKFIFLGF